MRPGQRFVHLLYVILCAVNAVPARAAPSDPEEALRGRIIYEVVIDAPPGEDVAHLRSLIDIAPGYLYSRRALRQAVVRLATLGRFTDIAVGAQRREDAVQLTFVLRPKRFVTDVTVFGAGPFEDAALAAAGGLTAGIESRPDVLQHAQQTLRATLSRRGYRRAEVDVREASAPEARDVTVGVFVKLGHPTHISAIRFVGSPRAVSGLLEDELTTHVGMRLDADVLGEDLQRLTAAYRQRGFLNVVVDEPRFTFDGTDEAQVEIPITAGERIRFAFRGNTLLPDSFLVSLLSLRQDERLGPSVLADFTERIRAAYIERGHLDIAVTMGEQVDAAHAVRTYTVAVHEGPFVPLATVHLPGAVTFDEEFLRQELLAVVRDAYAGTAVGPVMDDAGDQRLFGSNPGVTAPPDSLTPAAASGVYLGAVDPGGIYVPQLFEQAVRHLEALYRANGFWRVAVSRPQVVKLPDGRRDVTITISEGPQTLIRSVAVAGVAAEDRNLVNELVPLRPGMPLNEAQVENTRAVMLRWYSDRGYLFGKATAGVEMSGDLREADVKLQVDAGPRVIIAQVFVQGNHDTLEAVIRDRAAIEPGQIATPELMLQARRALVTLGIFRNVRIELAEPEVPAEEKDIIISVEERPRHSIGATVGLSTEDGIRGGVEYTQLNVGGTALSASTAIKLNRQIFFSLLGPQGELLAERYRSFAPFTEALERRLQLSLHAPYAYLLPQALSLQLDVVEERDNTLSYSLNNFSTTLIATISAEQHWGFSLEQSVVYNDLQCVSASEDCSNPVDRSGHVLRLDRGTFTIYKIGPRIRYDGRDNPFNPRSGFLATLSGDYARGLSNPIAYVKLEALYSHYLPLTSWLTLALSGRGGKIFNIGTDFPISDRFYFGGRSSLRGYFERGVVPVDACVTQGSNLIYAPHGSAACHEILSVDAATGTDSVVQTKGGFIYLLGKGELRLALSGELSFALFLDAGNLWLANESVFHYGVRFGTGFGIRYETPLGPIAFDFGFNPQPVAALGEGIFNLHFAIGVF